MTHNFIIMWSGFHWPRTAPSTWEEWSKRRKLYLSNQNYMQNLGLACLLRRRAVHPFFHWFFPLRSQLNSSHNLEEQKTTPPGIQTLFFQARSNLRLEISHPADFVGSWRSAIRYITMLGCKFIVIVQPAINAQYWLASKEITGSSLGVLRPPFGRLSPLDAFKLLNVYKVRAHFP